MIQLAWPFVFLVVGLAWAAVQYRSIASRDEVFADFAEDLGALEEIVDAHTEELKLQASQGPKLQAVEDEVRNLGQRIPTGLSRAR